VNLFLWTGEMGLVEREIMAAIVMAMVMGWTLLVVGWAVLSAAVLVEMIQRLLLVATQIKEISPLEAAQRDIALSSQRPSAIGPR
jgi:hypothetical protein